jgi:hypothetical protein
VSFDPSKEAIEEYPSGKDSSFGNFEASLGEKQFLGTHSSVPITSSAYGL